MDKQLKPMPFWLSLIVFGVPATLGLFSLYVVFPALDAAGAPVIWNFTFSVYGMFFLLLMASLVAYRLEGRDLSINAIASRFRVHPLSKNDWIWTAGLVFVYVFGQVLLSPTASWLANHLPFPLPDSLPSAVDPRIPQTTIPTSFLGVPVAGNVGVLLLAFTILLFNVFGEEFWWRGYVLPRQEITHGRWTWVIHGLLWTLFHIPFWWNLIALLPSTLSLSFVTSRLKNTTPGIIAHFSLNGLAVVMIFLGVLGAG